MAQNLLAELNIALKAVERAEASKCFCGPLVHMFKEPCKCDKQFQVRTAEMQLNTVREQIRKLNLHIVQKGD